MKKVLAILITLIIIVIGLNLVLFLSKDKPGEEKSGEEVTIIPTIGFNDGHEETDKPLSISKSERYFVVYYSFLSENGYVGVGVSDVLNTDALEEGGSLYIKSDKNFDELFQNTKTGKFQRNVVYLVEGGE